MTRSAWLPAGNVNIAGRVNLVPNGETTLNLDGFDGDDAFNIASGHGYGTINISGGNPSNTDVATLTGVGTAVNVQLGSFPVLTTDAVVTGGGLGIVNLSGVEVANIDTNVQDLNVTTTISHDQITVTPTAIDSATVQSNGVSPVVNGQNIAALNIDGAGGNDQIAVNGTGQNAFSWRFPIRKLPSTDCKP